jgi:hypothetical protein
LQPATPAGGINKRPDFNRAKLKVLKALHSDVSQGIVKINILFRDTTAIGPYQVVEAFI